MNLPEYASLRMVSLEEIKPAEYNPRHLDQESADALAVSLRRHGLIKPIIVAKNGTILAGHQRTKTMLRLGWTHAPAFVLGVVSNEDEVRFNQIHNSADVEPPQGERQRVTVPLQPGWNIVAPADLTGSLIMAGAARRDQILALLNRHGPWGSAVCSMDGEVVASNLYASAHRILRKPLLVYALEDGESANSALSRNYGRFSYEHLDRTTWMQSFAQMFRLREKVRENYSYPYELMLRPLLRQNPRLRVLDFGAGQMDYVRRLRGEGFDIRGVEFYFRKDGDLWVSQAQRFIDTLCNDLRTVGRFDVVICDFVLNSVDSLQAEADVLNSVAAFCRPGGTAIFSGRSRDFEETMLDRTTKATGKAVSVLVYLDENGFSGMFRNGAWRYQKFHYASQAYELADRHIGPGGKLYGFRRKAGSEVPATLVALERGSTKMIPSSAWGFQVPGVTHPAGREVMAASLAREFDLPLPDGSRFGRSSDILAAWEAALRLEGQ